MVTADHPRTSVEVASSEISSPFIAMHPLLGHEGRDQSQSSLTIIRCLDLRGRCGFGRVNHPPTLPSSLKPMMRLEISAAAVDCWRVAWERPLAGADLNAQSAPLTPTTRRSCRGH